jgi:hypothetical protein
VSMRNRISPRLLLLGMRYKGLLRPVVGKYLSGLGLENQRKYYAPEQRARNVLELREGIAQAWPGIDAPVSPFGALGALGVVDERLAAHEIDGLSGKDSTGLTRMFALMAHEQWVRAQEARRPRGR